MKSIFVVTSDKLLFQKIRLMLRERYTVEQIDHSTELPDQATVLFDIDTQDSPTPNGAIILSRKTPCTLRVPFRHEELIELLSRDVSAEAILQLSDSDKCATLGDKKIKLTDVEYRLLSVLMEHNGYVNKELILNTVWNDYTDAGVINVYIHYLRNKLEAGGERIILSSRKEGYKINERYRRR